jgi:hypothetical protein
MNESQSGCLLACSLYVFKHFPLLGKTHDALVATTQAILSAETKPWGGLSEHLPKLWIRSFHA